MNDAEAVLPDPAGPEIPDPEPGPPPPDLPPHQPGEPPRPKPGDPIPANEPAGVSITF